MGPLELSELGRVLTKLISETNGVSLRDTLDLAQHSVLFKERPAVLAAIVEFRQLLFELASSAVSVETLLGHPVAQTLGQFLRAFPQPFREEHIHLTGSLTADFIYPRLMQLLDGPHGESYRDKIVEIYGAQALPMNSAADIDGLIRVERKDRFTRYLQVLTLPKLVLIDRQAYADAAYHLASSLWKRSNVGRIRLKFTLSRATSNAADSLPGAAVAPEEVLLGLYQGFHSFALEQPSFDFILSPSFRKEPFFYDASRFASKQEDFLFQVNHLLGLLEKHPFLRDKVIDVDTVGDERGHFRKVHFEEMRQGFRKLQSRGFHIRSHHGETFGTLRRGVQAVDNAMNIWQIDALEHGVSLGVNPNYYFHMLFEKCLEQNGRLRPVRPESREGAEIAEMDWRGDDHIPDKLFAGDPLSADERRRFIKTKFHTAREVEHYQHDVLNRMLHKKVSLVALPSSNIMLTNSFPTYKDHPFSWWEKKGVELAVGTDNYITLSTDFIRELLILLFTDMEQLKITKLLMTVTGVRRRPVLSRLLWSMRSD